MMICYYRGGKPNEKCPVGITDLVLMYNAAQEGLHGPSKNDRSAFDLFSLCPGTKAGFVKFCKAHEQRIRTLLPDFRVIRAEPMLTMRVTRILTSADSLRNGLKRERICGH